MGQIQDTPESGSLRDLRSDVGAGSDLSMGPQLLWRYLWVVRRYVWMLVLFPLAGFAYRYYMSMDEPRVYRATAEIHIGQERVRTRGFDRQIGFRLGSSDLDTECYILKRSAPLAMAVIEKLDLVHSPEFASAPVEKKASLWKIIGQYVNSVIPTTKERKQAEAEQAEQPVSGTLKPERLVRGLLGRVSVSPIEGTRMVRVGFIGRHPKAVAQITNAFVQAFIEQESKNATMALERMLRYLREQQSEFEKKVEMSEEELLKYKSANKLVALESREEIQASKLSALSVAYSEARLESISAEGLYTTLKEAEDTGAVREALTAVEAGDEVVKLLREYSSLEADASRLANIYGPKHSTMVETKEKLAQAKVLLESEVALCVARAESKFRVGSAKAERLKTELERAKEEALALEEKMIRYGVIQRRAQSNQQLFDLLLAKANETGLVGQLGQREIQVINEASVPTIPVSTDRRRRLIAAAMFGFVIALAVAFLFDYLDHSIKDGDEVESFLGIKLLGGVGQFTEKVSKTRRAESVIVLSAPKSNLAEDFRSIRTNLLFAARESGRGSFVVTSAMPKEGKSTVAGNLAAVIGQSGKKVLWVDADMRRPVLHKILNVDVKAGLSTYLVGGAEKEDVVLATSMDNVYALPCGPIPPNQSELLGTARMQALTEWGEGEFDIVIFDTPPLGSVSDALVLGGFVHAAVFIIKSGKTSRTIARRWVLQLQSQGIDVLGAVLNDIDPKRSGYYGYPYYKSYYRYGSGYGRDYYSYGETDAEATEQKRETT